MLRLLDALLILAVLINLIKGAELLLRPHQQQWLQSKCETLALWFDYTRPITWYMKPETTRAFFSLSYVLLIFTGSLLFAMNVNPGNKGIFHIVLFAFMMTMAMCLARLSVELRTDKEKTKSQISRERVEKKLKEWLWRSPTITNSVLRQLILAIGGLICSVTLLLFLPALLIGWILLSKSPYQPLQLVLLTIAVFIVIYRKRIFYVMNGIANVGSLALFNLVLTLLIVLCEFALKFLRGFMWRVVEYNKGPLAALTLFITILLGIVEAYFRFHHK